MDKAKKGVMNCTKFPVIHKKLSNGVDVILP